MKVGGRTVKDSILQTPAYSSAYTNAQIDDYQCLRRRRYPHLAPITLSLEARFSHGTDTLMGTAGFGFWNAPYGDPTMPWPTLPSATWFFFASQPNHLPFLRGQTGWFASTIDARWGRAAALAPLVVPVTLGNQFRPIFNKLWPRIERWLGISAESIPHSLTDWHSYRLVWHTDGCLFYVDDQLIHRTAVSPRRPLGFVCWIDNQYLIATPQGRFRAGLVDVPQAQSLSIRNLIIH